LARAQGKTSKGKNMKLSIQSKVAAAVSAAFMTFTAGAMAQGHSMGPTGGPNNFGPINNSGLNVTLSGRQQREARHDAREQEEARQDAVEQRADRQQAVRQREQRFQRTSTTTALPTTGTHINPNGNASSTVLSPFRFLNKFGSHK
jgi:hypothetical protein